MIQAEPQASRWLRCRALRRCAGLRPSWPRRNWLIWLGDCRGGARIGPDGVCGATRLTRCAPWRRVFSRTCVVLGTRL